MSEKYYAYTLIDITESSITNPRTTNTIGYNQQQNLNTLLQLISLRSQPMDYAVFKLEAQDLVNFEFGKQFQGQHSVWKLEFASQHADVFTKNEDKTYFLKNDCDGAAFTNNLTETVSFTSNTFETLDSNAVNLYFKYHR
jgi:hypothetical protein